MITCKICLKGFGTEKTLIRHETEKHQLPKHSCEVCGGRFKRLEYLKRHASSKKCYPNSSKNHSEESMRNTAPTNIVDTHSAHSPGARVLQFGTGLQPSVKQEDDSIETISENDVENEDEESSEEEMTDQEADRTEEDSPVAETENSSEDSDCDFSSGDESSNRTVEGDEKSDVCCEDISCDGSDTAEDEKSIDIESHSLPKFGGFARWKSNGNGLYVFWSSQTQKPYVVQHREWLAKLLETPYKRQKELISEASNSQLDVFREIAVNVLEGRAAMHTRTLKFFRKNAQALRTLASNRSSYKMLRRTLKAGRDGLLPIILLNAVPKCVKSGTIVFK